METRKKVLVVIPYFPPNAGGGAEKYAYNICRRLVREYNWDVVVVTSTSKKITTPARRTNGIKIYRLPYKFKLSNSPLSIAWFWKIRTIIRTENPDIINVHAPVPGIGDITAAVCGNRPLVVTYHMGSMKKHKSSLNTIIWLYENVVLRRMLNKARQIICSSDYVRNDFLISYRHKTRTLTPAVDTDLFHPAERCNDAKSILFVGALSRGDQHKGLDILIRSCQQLKSDFPDLTLTVVGGGDGVDFYRKMAKKLQLEDAVTFTGRLEGKTLAERFRQSAYYAHPSSNDSFGLVVAEAMASGLPVVSTTAGGIPTLVDNGETGLLVEPRDEPAFTEALRRVLSDSALAERLGEAGRVKAVTRLHWHERTARTDALFRQVTGEMNAPNQKKKSR